MLNATKNKETKNSSMVQVSTKEALKVAIRCGLSEE